MKFDLYLSEMAITDLHGGGLTLQRVMGNDLMQIKYFAHLSRFAYDLPAARRFGDKDIDLTSVWEGNAVRSIIGRSLAAAINDQSFIKKKAAEKAARALAGKFENDELINCLVCPQGLSSIYTLEALKRRHKVKYITWVMDDHVVQYNNGEWHYPKGVGQVLEKHLREAEHVFVISPAMQEFYHDRFGIGSTVLFSPFDLPANNAQPVHAEKQPFKIGYFGAVTAWQLDALNCVAKALTGTETQLHIYSGVEKLPEELCLDNVYLQEWVSPGQVLLTMRNYDVVLLPMSFLEKMRNMSAFNIATKMSEYLASGVPILAVGPPHAAMMKYLKGNSAAVVVEECDENAVRNAFNLLHYKEGIVEILKNAQNLVRNETGTLPMRKRWAEGINRFIS